MLRMGKITQGAKASQGPHTKPFTEGHAETWPKVVTKTPRAWGHVVLKMIAGHESGNSSHQSVGQKRMKNCLFLQSVAFCADLRVTLFHWHCG